MNRSLLSIKELSKELGISVTSIYRLRQRGIIKHIKIGGRVLFDYEEVLSSLKEQTNLGGMSCVNQ
ncbi:MAG: helix-turn-helix domain-containing protein [Chlorobiota bacterium]